MHNRIINFNKKISQALLNDIICNKDIDYNKYRLSDFKNKILNIKKEYECLSKLKIEDTPRYWYFWEIIEKKYKNFNKKLTKKRKSNISLSSKCKQNIIRTMYTKDLGFNPTILTLLIYSVEIEDIVKINNHNLYYKLFEKANFWPSTIKEKKLINKCLKKERISIISNLCPDYDNIKIGKDLYSYTFNQLNDQEGLGAIRLLENIKNIKEFFNLNNKSFSYDVYYGDFESYSDENCSRLEINKNLFLTKLKKSVQKMKEHNQFNNVNLFVDKLSNETEWNEQKKINKNKIIYRYNNDSNFKKELNEIARSRKMLYLNWFPNLILEEYYKLVIDQGAEYATMGDIILKNYINPLIIGADHPRMKIFYYFNNEIPVIYLNKGY